MFAHAVGMIMIALIKMLFDHIIAGEMNRTFVRIQIERHRLASVDCQLQRLLQLFRLTQRTNYKLAIVRFLGHYRYVLIAFLLSLILIFYEQNFL